MPQDTLERVQVFLSQTQANRFAMLLDLTKLLPESLLNRAIWLAKNSTRDAVTAFLIHALAKRLPTKSERIRLTNSCPLPQGIVVKELSLPEGRKAKRLIAQLSEEQRYLVFDQFFVTLEAKGGGGLERPLEPTDRSRRSHSTPRSSSAWRPRLRSTPARLRRWW